MNITIYNNNKLSKYVTGVTQYSLHLNDSLPKFSSELTIKEHIIHLLFVISSISCNKICLCYSITSLNGVYKD